MSEYKLTRVVGATSQIFQIFITASNATTFAGVTGLAFNTATLVAYYHKDSDTTATAITLATMTVGTYTSGGFKEIDATNMPGYYQFCPPNACFSSGASVCFSLQGVANTRQVAIEVDLTPVPANLTQVDGAANVSATLNLKQLNIVNSSGTAIIATSSGSNGSGILATGNGSGNGIGTTGGSTGSGLACAGGATSGPGASFYAQTSGHGLVTAGVGSGNIGFVATGGTNGNAVQLSGQGSGSGLVCLGGATGHGIAGVGGATSGHGALLYAVGAGAGMDLIGVGTTSILAAQGISGALDASVYTSIADALLKRDMSSVTGEASRSLLNCLRFIRNKWSSSGSTITIYKEDNTTSAWTGTVTTDAAAAPITIFVGN